MAELAVDIVQLAERTAPGALAGTVRVYTKDVAGVTTLFTQASDGIERQVAPPAAANKTYAGLTDALTIGSAVVYATPQNGLTFNAFASTRDALTLAANTAYKMRGMLTSATPGGGTISVELRFNGTATYSIFDYMADAAFVAGTGSVKIYAGATGGSNAQYNLGQNYTIEGRFTTSAGGTFIPAFFFGGTLPNDVTLELHSFFEVITLGPSSFTAKGFS